MKLPATLAAALVVATLAGCKPPPCPECPPPAPPPPQVDVKAEEQAIRELDAKWVEAIAAKDVDRIVSYYAPTGALLPPGSEPLRGDDLRNSWAGMLQMPNVVLSFAPSEVHVAANGLMAWDIGTYQFSYDGAKGKVEDHGKYVQVWEKIDGVWKCVIDMHNSSIPAPPPLAAETPPAPLPRP